MIIAKKTRLSIIIESILFAILLTLFIIFAVKGDLSFTILFGVLGISDLIFMCKWLFSNHNLIQISDNKLIINQHRVIIVPLHEIVEISYKLETPYSGRLFIKTTKNGNIVLLNVSDPDKVKEKIDKYRY